MKRYVRNGHTLDRSRYVHKIGDRWYVAKRCIAGTAGGTIYAVPTSYAATIGHDHETLASKQYMLAASGLRTVAKCAKSFAKRSDAVEYAAKVFGYEPLP